MCTEAKKSTKKKKETEEDELISQQTGEGFIRQAGLSKRHQTLVSPPPLYLFFVSFFFSSLFSTLIRLDIFARKWWKKMEKRRKWKERWGRVAEDVRKMQGEERKQRWEDREEGEMEVEEEVEKWGTEPRAATSQQGRWMTFYLWTLGLNETSRGQTMASLTHTYTYKHTHTHTHTHTHKITHTHKSRLCM